MMPTYPNPSADLTSIHFNVFRNAQVKVVITNLDGRELVTLVDKQMSQGRFTTQWNGSDASANACAAGTYLATLIVAGKVILSQRVLRQ